MIYALVAINVLLIALTVLFVLVLYRMTLNHQVTVDKILERGRLERSILLDRIQHPHIRPVETSIFQATEPPRDAAELAWVGMEVPDHVHVGTEESNGNGAT